MFKDFEWVMFVGSGRNDRVGVCLYTLQGLQVKVASVNQKELRTVISQYHPVEVIYNRFQTPLEF
jgi:DNA mismatch repair ATPase MutS